MPRLVPIASLWSLSGHPTPSREWSLETKFRAIARAGFEGVTSTTPLKPEHRRLAEKHGLKHLIGFIRAEQPADFARQIREQKEAGAEQINVHLGSHDTPPALATRQWIRMVREAEKIGDVVLSLEVHRDRCTETPEKTYEIAARFHAATGEPIRLNFDFSHLAVVKHLTPGNYAERLLTDPALVQHATQLHFRPFNGHHCQVPVTYRGKLTPEVISYLAFARTVMAIWKAAHKSRDDVLFACPEMGPRRDAGAGYNITSLPPAWTDANVLKGELSKLWSAAR